jgi:hypothetical protein
VPREPDEGLFGSDVVEDNSVIEASLSLKKHCQRFPTAWEHVVENDLLKRLAEEALLRTPVDRILVDVSYMRKSKDAPPPSRLIGTNYLHADVHYPSPKARLLLDEVDESNGAFVYAKGCERPRRVREGGRREQLAIKFLDRPSKRSNGRK